MVGILIAKMKGLIRRPGQFIIMTLLSIIFALILGGGNIINIAVPTYVEHESASEIISEIEAEGVFELEVVTEEQLLDKVSNGKNELGLILYEDDFEIIVGIDSHNVMLLEQSLRHVYVQNEMNHTLEKTTNITNIKEELTHYEVFDLETVSFQGEDSFVYERDLHSVFGFTLFFVIYTIAYSVFQILLEKNSGIWDRIITSPVKKWEMYVANFLYSFIIGYVQIFIVFLIFRYMIKIDFHGNFMKTLLVMIPYVLAIVALSIFIVSVVKSVQQFNAVIPIVAVSMAMIGGAYWPLEIVDSQIMITLSKIVPITYGMELLNGVTIYHYSLEDLLSPISILLFMTVLFTGIGVHLMEKRYVS